MGRDKQGLFSLYPTTGRGPATNGYSNGILGEGQYCILTRGSYRRGAYLDRDETIQSPRRLALLDTPIQASVDRRHDTRPAPVPRWFGVDGHLAHDRLAQDAVALPAVARMRLAAVQPHALDECGFEVEQVLARRDARAGREGVALGGRGAPAPRRLRRFRRRRRRRGTWAVCVCVCGCGARDGDDDGDRPGARVRRLPGERGRRRPRRARRPAARRAQLDAPPFLALEPEPLRVHEGQPGHGRHMVGGRVGLGQV